MLTHLVLPTLKSDDVVIENYSIEQSESKKITNEEALSKSLEYSKDLGLNYENIINTAPIFNPANFALGFLGAVSSKSFSCFTGSNKMSDIMSLFATQDASTFICESDLLSFQLPEVKYTLIININIKKEHY